MTKNKENALMDFMDMIVKSWTWARMTPDEHKRFDKVAHGARLNGTWEQRYLHLLDIYDGFLYGLGYTDHKWREKEEVPGF